jgi:hypothetical protein
MMILTNDDFNKRYLLIEQPKKLPGRIFQRAGVPAFRAASGSPK